MMKRTCVLLLLVLASVLMPGGCKARELNYFSYRAKDFRTELRGALHGVPFCAVVEVKREAGGYRVRAEYRSDPEGSAEFPLAEITVLAVCQPNGTVDGDATVQYRGLAAEVKGEAIEGLLLPLASLLFATSFSTVQRTEEGFLLGLEGGELLLDNGMRPRVYRGEGITFSVLWWEASS